MFHEKFRVTRGKYGTDLEKFLEGHFEGHSGVMMVFLNGTPSFSP